MDAIVRIVLDNREFVRHFNKAEYPEYFARFKAECMPVFELFEAEPDSVPEKAASLLDGLEAAWREAGRWKKISSAARDADKLLLALYLCPAARDCGLDNARRFADELSAKWNARWPDSPFYAGEYSKLLEGFNKTLLGLKLS